MKGVQCHFLPLISTGRQGVCEVYQNVILIGMDS